MVSTANDQLSRPLSLTFRMVGAVEVLIGAAIVVGHNVFRAVPNEVPILALLGLLSIRLRDGGWSAMGFKRPPSWASLVAIAVAAAALRVVLGHYVIDPLCAQVWPPAEAPAGAEEITGHLGYALVALVIVWGFAAFGEETAYRGYLLTRTADLGGRSSVGYWMAVVVVSVLFGYGHYYKGPAGIVDSGIAGAILGSAYMVAGRNLWASILAHGLIDTFGVTALYFGWDV